MSTGFLIEISEVNWSTVLFNNKIRHIDSLYQSSCSSGSGSITIHLVIVKFAYHKGNVFFIMKFELNLKQICFASE